MGQELLITSVFLAGIASFLSPCILPLLPVYLSILSGNEDTSKKFEPTLVIKTLVFILGISVTFVTLGFGAGILGSFLYSKTFLTIGGSIVIIMGVIQTGLIKIPFLQREKTVELNRSRRGDYIGAFLLGLTFSLGWTPCIGPVLAAILTVAASGDNPFYGAALMGIYTLGLAIPFLIISIFANVLLVKVRKLSKYTPVFKIVGGIIIILMGILLMTGKLNVLVTVFT